MKYSKAVFDYSLKSQARYICFLAKGIVDGIYQKGGFSVLPYQVPGNFWTVYFPDLDLSRSFWQEIAKTQHDDFSKPFSKLAEDEVILKLKTKLNKELENSWRSQEDKFWQLCEKFLNLKSLVSKIKEVRIIPTNFGTFGSYHPNITKTGYTLTLSSRSDVGGENIVHLLLMNLYNLCYRDAAEIGEIDWYKRQAVTEFLVQKTIFSELFILCKVTATTPAHIADSVKYLTKLGFPPASVRDFSSLENILTVKERILFDLLKHAEGKLVDFNMIGDSLWSNNEDKFSLYAITKLIEGLRVKMRSTGFDSSILKTSKGQGYFLS